jgi:hypothetical protein
VESSASRTAVIQRVVQQLRETKSKHGRDRSGSGSHCISCTVVIIN